MFNRLTILVLLATALLTNGCALWKPDRIHYSWDEKTAAACKECFSAPTTPLSNKDQFIGIALSGGGARASVFAAAAMEALTEEGLMQRATHISSVSGGGFAAAYYVLMQSNPCAENHSDTKPCVNADFAAFKKTMRHNFFSDMTLRQVFKPNRFSSPTRRLSSLQDALDDQFINAVTFGELPASPVLLVNGARYDDGRRFVFSNLPIAEAESDIEPFTQKTLRTASFSLPGCTRPTPKNFPLSLAIAVSAGFPPILGPAAIEMPASCSGGATHYWHLGDGGILDNTGVETLEEYALRVENPKSSVKQIFIFSIDAGRQASPELMMQTRNLNLWTNDPGRVVDIVGMRANAYRKIALNQANAKSEIPIQVIKIRYTNAELQEWPRSCGRRENNADAISAYLAKIPTNLKISDCDADLMELAAHDVVSRTLSEQREALKRAGLSW